ncbi:MAG TPA: hypothetical protein VLE99_02265 [Candidatus Saccharimonadales bacterium]|nr:hypothetical protein [Candidatus Saccharimonadales bacterium]
MTTRSRVRNRKKLWKLLPLARAIGVLSAVGVATTLVTFAAIQSTGNALTGNTIETATANLQISKDGTNFFANVAGYDFSGLVPGGAAQPVSSGGYLVALKNTGSATLLLSLDVPVQPSVTGITDLSKVRVLLTPPMVNGVSFPAQTFKLSDLIAGPVALTGSGSSLIPNATTQFRLQVAMDGDAVNGSGATINGLDLSFSGKLQ